MAIIDICRKKMVHLSLKQKDIVSRYESRARACDRTKVKLSQLIRDLISELERSGLKDISLGLKTSIFYVISEAYKEVV